MNKVQSQNTANYDLSAPFLFMPNSTHIIQIHPTLRCNLRCKHCYSESSSDQRDVLHLTSLQGFIRDAGHLGYRYVGISGGEPLLWNDLESFLDFALNEGFSTSLTTNGTLLNKKSVSRILGRVGSVAVSVDGPPRDHAAMRGSLEVFSSMQHGLSILRDSEIPFTLAFTLTKYNADRLSWLYNFADEEGAFGINVHPLSGHGAANTHLASAVPDSFEFKIASWLLALLMEQRGQGGPAVTLDVINRNSIDNSCWPMLIDNEEQFHSTPFADLVPSLVVEPDGSISPFTYGFPRSWSIGFIDHEPLDLAVKTWRESYASHAKTLLHFTLKRLAAKNAEYVDLFGEMLISANMDDFKLPYLSQQLNS